MRVQKTKLSAFVLVLAGALLQTGCDDTIRITTSPLSANALVLNPVKGQTIHWNNVTPAFSKPSPCETNPTAQTPECKVKEDAGLYLYHCLDSKCTDPEVVVGPDSTRGTHTLAITPMTLAADPVSLYCDSNQIALDPQQLNVTAAAAQSVVATWVSTGNGAQKISYPQVTFKTATPDAPLPTCTTYNAGGAYPYVACTLTAPASSTVYTYWAQSSNNECNHNVNQNGQLNLTVH